MDDDATGWALVDASAVDVEWGEWDALAGMGAAACVGYVGCTGGGATSGMGYENCWLRRSSGWEGKEEGISSTSSKSPAHPFELKEHKIDAAASHSAFFSNSLASERARTICLSLSVSVRAC
ncbi:hypothetical protein O6H91_11G004600 [Diphasiastrum complanatum]|uniref:Uncharacterized protein n=1 Tax=Diphasiastrum complanatum TaxID=34168 RepID=A0ACC2C669_DIPCM|nr:hypothetical protein O6H91_11G004600 [Diphasiastrum complanatum]